MRTSLLTMLMLCTGSVLAATAEQTNLASEYPRSNCSKPDMLAPANPQSSPMELQLRRAQIDRYNDSRASFVSCIKAYVATAQADIDRITRTVNSVVEEANQQ